MYWTIFKIISGIFILFGIVMPIVPSIRRWFIKYLEDQDGDNQLMFDCLEIIDEGFRNIGEAMIGVLMYLFIILCISTMGIMISLFWPLLIAILILGSIFYKLNKNSN